MRRAVNLVWLTLVWVTLWETLSWANVLGGLLVSGAVLLILPPKPGSSDVGFRLLPAIKLLIYFLWKLIEASGKLAFEIVTPRNRINAAVVSVTLTSDVDGIIIAVANMISLTPGTVTLEVDRKTNTLFIHVLHLLGLEAERASVHHLETLTLAAFPPRPARVPHLLEGSS